MRYIVQIINYIAISLLVLLNLTTIYFYINLVYYGCHYGLRWTYLCLTLFELILLVMMSLLNLTLFFILRKRKIPLVINVSINLLIIIGICFFCIKVLN